MQERIGVDVAAVEGLADGLDRSLRTLEAVLGAVGPGWERAGAAAGSGPLRAAVTEAGQDWTRYAVALGRSVDALGRATRESARAYAEVEDRVAGGWPAPGTGWPA